MAFGSGLMGDFWAGYNQRRAASGRSLTPGEMRGLISPMLDYEAQTAKESAQRQQQTDQQAFQNNLAQQQMAQQKKSGTANAVSQGTGLLINAGLGYGQIVQAGKNSAALAAQAAAQQQSNALLASKLAGGAANTGTGVGAGTANIGTTAAGESLATTGGVQAAGAGAGTAGAAGSTGAAAGTGAGMTASSLGYTGWGTVGVLGHKFAERQFQPFLESQLGMSQREAGAVAHSPDPLVGYTAGAAGDYAQDKWGKDAGNIASIAVDPIGAGSDYLFSDLF